MDEETLHVCVYWKNVECDFNISLHYLIQAKIIKRKTWNGKI
jgi:hypothetical protein